MTSAALSNTESLTLSALTLASTAIIYKNFQNDGEPLIASFAFSGIAFAASYALIRWLGPTFIKAGLKGKDMSKVHKKEIPETMGAVCAIVYLFLMMVFIPFPFYKDIVAATSGGGNRDVVLEAVESVNVGRFLHRFPHGKVSSPNPSTCKQITKTMIAGFLPLCAPVPAIRMHTWASRRSLRHPLAAQVLHSSLRIDTSAHNLLC
jgi:hypothetical protein